LPENIIALNIISRLGEYLPIPPLKSILGPFIIKIGLEHPHDVLKKDPIFESAIIKSPAFSTQRNTGLEIKNQW
jgi:hypothetical protein